MEYRNCLYHNGVKGMRWGVRKNKQSTLTLGGRKVPVGHVPDTMTDYDIDKIIVRSKENKRLRPRDARRLTKLLFQEKVRKGRSYTADPAIMQANADANRIAMENGRRFMEVVAMQNMQFQNQQFMNMPNQMVMNQMMGF